MDQEIIIKKKKTKKKRSIVFMIIRSCSLLPYSFRYHVSNTEIRSFDDWGFSIWLIVSNFSMIFLWVLLILLCALQKNKACFSSSNTLHILHTLLFLSIYGLWYLPVSILSLWQDNLHLVIIILLLSFIRELYRVLLKFKLNNSL